MELGRTTGKGQRGVPGAVGVPGGLPSVLLPRSLVVASVRLEEQLGVRLLVVLGMTSCWRSWSVSREMALLEVPVAPGSSALQQQQQASPSMNS